MDHDRQSGIMVTPGPTAHASVSATVLPFLSVGFGVAGTLVGDDLDAAAASAGWARVLRHLAPAVMSAYAEAAK